MPKAKKPSPYCCMYCTKTFTTQRALSMHRYHNRGRCGYSTNRTTLFSPKEELHSRDTNGEDDDHIHDGGGDDDTDSTNTPFVLTSSTLSRIPGEASVVTHSVDDRVHVELLHLLEQAQAPDYLFKNILEWAIHAKSLSYSFAPHHTSRSAILNDIQQHFNMQNLRPTTSYLQLESIHQTVPIVTFDFKTMLISLLTNKQLMQPDNLVINDSITHQDGTIDYAPWYEPYESNDGILDEVLSGHWYKDTISTMDCNNFFLCPLIFYIDKTFIDPNRSRFNLEPFKFTLAMFNRKCRSQFQFWRTLAYIPECPDSDDKRPALGHKARNYHQMLSFVLKGLAEIHANPSTLNNFPLRIGNKVKIVNLCIPVAFIIADTQGADKLCGRYVVYNDTVQRLHRTCMCTPCEATITKKQCEWVKMDDMMDMMERNDKAELKSYSQHYIPQHAFQNIDFGSNPHGIYGATPNDTLHGVKLGIIKYLLEIFMDQDMTPSAHFDLNQALRDTLPHLKQSANSQFPRLYFPNGISTLKNITAEECVGMMFITYILCITGQGHKALRKSEKMTNLRIIHYITLFEKLLIFLSWLTKNDGYWRLDDRKERNEALKSIKTMMNYISENFPWDKQNWNISKMHELLHIPYFIDMFGCPMNWDSAACERMHKDTSKKPGKKTQKRHATFTTQAANRLTDRQVIDLAYHQLVEQPSQHHTSEPTRSRIPSTSGSTYSLHITSTSNDENDLRYHVSVRGNRALKVDNLSQLIYPDLVEYIVAYFTSFDTMPTTIRCQSEYTNEEGIIFRAHHDYRDSGYWHDWALTSYQDDSEKGYTNVPSRILCFLPDGIPGDNQCYVVCHPCQWRKKKVTKLVTKWTLVPCSEAEVNEIPYDVVPATSLYAQCLIVPDLEEPGTVYQIANKDEWAQYI